MNVFPGSVSDNPQRALELQGGAWVVCAEKNAVILLIVMLPWPNFTTCLSVNADLFNLFHMLKHFECQSKDVGDDTNQIFFVWHILDGIPQQKIRFCYTEIFQIKTYNREILINNDIFQHLISAGDH